MDEYIDRNFGINIDYYDTPNGINGTDGGGNINDNIGYNNNNNKVVNLSFFRYGRYLN